MKKLLKPIKTWWRNLRSKSKAYRDKQCKIHKHYWEANFNKNGDMFRRTCSNCGSYQNRVKGKWVGYAELKYNVKGKGNYNGQNRRF